MSQSLQRTFTLFTMTCFYMFYNMFCFHYPVYPPARSPSPPQAQEAERREGWKRPR